MHVVRDPDPTAVAAFLRHELPRLKARRGHLIEVLAACRVDYRGRAASTLEEGERLVLVKGDGTLLVHAARKAKPVNWMPAGANEFSVETHGDEVRLVALRRRPHEELVRITFRSVRLLVSVPLQDAEELVLRRTEGDLHRLFFEHPALLETGLVLTRNERATRRGPVDLWGTDRLGRRVLVEVKRAKAGIQEATQLWRYVENERGGENGENTARGILVAPGISKEAHNLLADKRLEYVELDWDRLLTHVEAPRAAGQSTLGRFEADAAGPQRLVPERTERTGKRRG